MPTLVVKSNKCSVSIASRATIAHKAYDAVISNMGFVNSVLGNFTVDRQTTGWRSARCDIFAPCDTSWPSISSFLISSVQNIREWPNLRRVLRLGGLLAQIAFAW